MLSQKPNRTLKDSVFKLGDIITIPYIQFDMCCRGCPEDGISFTAKDSLKIIGEFITKHPNLIFQIGVHTDSRDDAARNKSFSQTRANSLRQYLIKNFPIDSTKVIAKGFGESQPLFDDKAIQAVKTKQDKESLHQKNRRTDLRVLGQK